MKIIIKADKIKLNKELKDFIEEKIGSLEKFLKALEGDEDSYFHGRKAKIEAWVG